MKMYIPQNSGAYINLGGPWSGTSQFHHGMGIYFNADGTARSEFNETHNLPIHKINGLI